MGKLKIGLIGCGRHAWNVMLPILNRLEVEITAVCDSQAERLAEYRAVYRDVPVFSDWCELLTRTRPEALIVLAGPRVHYEAAREGLKAGCNVFVEKTPTETAAQAAELVELEVRTSRYVMAGFNRRWATAYRMAQEIAARPALGGVKMFFSKYHARDYGSEERYIHNHVVHHLDLIRFLLGEVTDLHVRRIKLSEGKVGFNMSFETDGGAIGCLQSASLQSDSYPQEYVEFLGNGWEVIVDNHQDLVFNRDGRKASERLRDQPVRLDDTLDTLVWNQNRTMFPPSLFQDSGFEIELEHFTRACRENRPPRWHADDTLKTMQLLERFTAAARTSAARS